MKRMLFVVPVVVACSALLWAAPQFATPEGTTPESTEDAPLKPDATIPEKITRISLHETLNFWGGGEAFDLTLGSNGTATWIKHQPAPKSSFVDELFDGAITKTRFDTLVTALRDAKFFDLKPFYASGKTDQETTTLDVIADGKTRSVASYSDGAPPAFFTIVNALKAERNAIQWTKSDTKDNQIPKTTQTKTSEPQSVEPSEVEAAKGKAEAAKMCEVHHVALQPDTLPISYGMPSLFAFEIMEAERKSFPHAATQVLGGCEVSDHSPKTEIVSFCPKCREAEAKWIKAHQKKK